MAVINPYASRSHDATKSACVLFRIDRYMPIVLIVLACVILNSVRTQLHQTPMQLGMIPDAGVGVTLTLKDPAVLFMTATGQEAVTVMQQDGTTFSCDEAIQASEIIEYLTKELEAGQNKNHVMIVGDADINVGEVGRIQQIIGDAFEDLESTYIAVKGE